MCSRSTILAQLKSDDSNQLQYKSGDHVAIFPANSTEMVQALIDKLSDTIDPDQPINVEAQREVKGELGFSREIITRFQIVNRDGIKCESCEYSPIITKPEANNFFNINTQVIIPKTERKFHQKRANNWQPFCSSR